MITVILFGVVYFFIGAVFPNPPASDPSQFAWRLAAWVLSIGAFASQIGVEHFRFRNRPGATAWHAAAAVALGALAIAVAANVHAVNSHHKLILSALAIWPLAGGILAFAAAWIVAAVLNRLRPNAVLK